MHVGLNGREWLARQLDAASSATGAAGNCFVWLEDVAATQQLADAQLRTAWEAAAQRARGGRESRPRRGVCGVPALVLLVGGAERVGE